MVFLFLLTFFVFSVKYLDFAMLCENCKVRFELDVATIPVRLHLE